MTDALEQRQHVLVEDEFEQGIVPRDHFSCATTVEQDLRAGFGDLLERTCASTLRLPVTRSTRISSLPPVAFWPNSRAGMTRVLLKTIRSPGRT